MIARSIKKISSQHLIVHVWAILCYMNIRFCWNYVTCHFRELYLETNFEEHFRAWDQGRKPLEHQLQTGLQPPKSQLSIFYSLVVINSCRKVWGISTWGAIVATQNLHHKILNKLPLGTYRCFFYHFLYNIVYQELAP